MNTIQSAAKLSPVHLLDAFEQLLRRLVAQMGRQRQTAVARGRLERGVTVWILKPHGRRITCEAGALWLTFDGEPVDVILEAGQSHLCAKTSKLLIHPLGQTAVYTS